MMCNGSFRLADFHQSAGIGTVAAAYNDHHIYIPCQLSCCRLSVRRGIADRLMDAHASRFPFDRGNQAVCQKRENVVCITIWTSSRSGKASTSSIVSTMYGDSPAHSATLSISGCFFSPTSTIFCLPPPALALFPGSSSQKDKSRQAKLIFCA